MGGQPIGLPRRQQGSVDHAQRWLLRRSPPQRQVPTSHIARQHWLASNANQLILASDGLMVSTRIANASNAKLDVLKTDIKAIQELNWREL